MPWAGQPPRLWGCGVLAAVSGGKKGFPEISRCLPRGRGVCVGGRACAHAHVVMIVAGRRGLSGVVLCLAPGPRVPGESPTLGSGLMGLMLKHPDLS